MEMKKRKIFVDSNVWCYYFDKGAKEHLKVAQFLERAIKCQTIVINTVVVMEVAHFLIKNLGAKGKDKVDLFLSLPLRILDFNYEQALAAVNLLAKYSNAGIGGRDATLLASMRTEKVNEIITNDSAFTQVKGIKVINPIQ